MKLIKEKEKKKKKKLAAVAGTANFLLFRKFAVWLLDAIKPRIKPKYGLADSCGELADLIRYEIHGISVWL